MIHYTIKLLSTTDNTTIHQLFYKLFKINKHHIGQKIEDL